MNWLAAVIVSAAIAWFVTAQPQKSPRHHIYYCVHPEILAAFPCMYRKNDPVDV